MKNKILRRDEFLMQKKNSGYGNQLYWVPESKVLFPIGDDHILQMVGRMEKFAILKFSFCPNLKYFNIQK